MDKSDVTLFVSIIGSIFIPLCMLVINYRSRSTKKKLMLSYTVTQKYDDIYGSTFVVTANNTGNRKVKINRLGIGCYKKERLDLASEILYFTPYVDEDKLPSGYEPSETTEIKSDVEPYNTVDVIYPLYNYEYFKKKFIKSKLYVFAEDADGKIYKRLIES